MHRVPGKFGRAGCGLKRQMAVVCLVLLFVSALQIKAREMEEFTSGRIYEKITIQKNPALSYSLYLPVSYSPEKKSAVIYIFDPVARGAFAVERFRSAAEKYNYILISSNNSRNGLDSAALEEIIKTIWKDTHDRFLIDENRTYAAGFSGGARVASLMAALCRTCITGVIGSGAGFSSQVKLTAQQNFIFFGAVGIDDYNYPELINLQKSLTELNLKNNLETFDGVHQWMPPETAEKALAWMSLQAIKKGNLPRDEKFISEILAKRVEEAKKFLADGNILFAERSYRGIVDDFSELKEVSEYSQKLTELNESAELKKAQKLEVEQINRQSQIANNLIALKLKPVEATGEDMSNLQMIRNLISDLNKRAVSADETDRHVAKRTLAQVYAVGLESAMFNYEPQKKFTMAIAYLELAVEAAPKNWNARFELAKAYALDRQKKKALQTLEEAVDLGFQNLKQIETEESFADWRSDERFQKLLEILRKRTVDSNR